MPAQVVAIGTPCLLAGECARPMYAYQAKLFGRAVLTVDAGYE